MGKWEMRDRPGITPILTFPLRGGRDFWEAQSRRLPLSALRGGIDFCAMPVGV